jgi:hypothetical protein
VGGGEEGCVQKLELRHGRGDGVRGGWSERGAQ